MKSVSALNFGRIVRAAGYSWKGMRTAWRDEAAFRQELCGFAVLAPLTLALQLPALHTVVLFALMGNVLAIELLNSGLEAIVDKTSPDQHALAGKAKDCASAAVFVATVTLAGAWLALAGPTAWRALFA